MGVLVPVVAMGTMRVLDHLDQPMSMRIGVEIMPVNVLIIVSVWHRPDVTGRGRSGQLPAGQQQSHQAGRRSDQQGARLGDRLLQRTGLDHRRLQAIE